ncbi:MAG TPA: hypothetical protein VL295_07180, partial [Gemmatimonadales bacterium]|nr:hypothetical protein [Gemmatimonadales bacterium]
TIAAGDSVRGNVSSSSCLLWSDYNYVETRAESWTLHAKKNTAYIVRLRHQADTNAFDNWAGDLVLYGRNAQGDPQFETGWWNDFGVANGNGGYNEEMMLATDRDQTWSIRVEAASTSDTGHYTLSVESCPLHPITPAAGATGINVATGCTSLTFQSDTTRIAFFSYAGDTSSTFHVTSTRTAGAAYQYGEITGPDNDVSNWTDFSYSTSFAGDTVMNSPNYTPNAIGRQTLWVGVNADSAATISVALTSTPIPAPRSFTSTPRPHRRGTR